MVSVVKNHRIRMNILLEDFKEYRLSLHDPLLPLNIESNCTGGAKQIATELADFIKAYDKLDVNALLDFVK